MLRVEFHAHTIYSKDSLVTPDRLIKGCRRKKIDRVVITDHNTIEGARVAHNIDPELVIIGEEIMTTRGEILAAYVKDEIPPGLSPQETIRKLRKQGSFISISHPFDLGRSGHWELDDLMGILPNIDAIEVYNSRCWLPAFNHQAKKFAERMNLPGTVGSDAHALIELGRAVLLLEGFEGPDGMRKVIRDGKPIVKWSPPWFHLISRSAVIQKWLNPNLDMKKQP